MCCEELQPNVMVSRTKTKTKRFFICLILYNDHSAPLCARCSLSWAKIRKKIRHSVCLRAFFLFEVYYCSMLFSKNLINVRKNSLFGILHSRKNRNIEPKKVKKRFKTRKIAVLVCFFHFQTHMCYSYKKIRCNFAKDNETTCPTN